MAVDGNFLLPAESNIFKMRRKMRESGVVFANVVMDGKGGLATGPIISAPGCLDEIHDRDILENIAEDIAASIKSLQKSHKNQASNDQIITIIRNSIRRILKEENGKQPQIMVYLSKL